MWERLDHGLANNEWFLRFAGARVYHLHSDSSNHLPLLIMPSGLEMDRKKKVFRFEEMWLLDKGCTEIVEAVWCSNDFVHSDFQVLKKIERCGVELTKWSREKFGSLRKELDKKRRMLADAKRESMKSRMNNRVRELKLEIKTLMDKEN